MNYKARSILISLVFVSLASVAFSQDLSKTIVPITPIETQSSKISTALIAPDDTQTPSKDLPDAATPVLPAAQSKSEPDQTISQRTETLPDSPLHKNIASCPLSIPTCQESSFSERTDLSAVRSVASPRQRVADKKFWLVTSVLAASTALHVLAVNHCRHTVGIENCEGRYGPYRAMQGLNIGFSVGMAAIGYGWKKMDDEDGGQHSKWWTIPVGTAAFFGFTAIQQYRKHCPAGTHFSVYECE